MIRNRADARWLPARFNCALARLIAFTISTNRGPRHEAGLVLSIDRHQSAVENCVVAVWFYTSSVAYLYAAMQAAVPRVAALAIAAFVAPMIIQFFTHLFSSFGTRKWVSVGHMRLNTAVLMAVMTAVSAVAITTSHWTRYVGGVALSLIALNGLASVVMRALAARVAALEESFEAGT